MISFKCICFDDSLQLVSHPVGLENADEQQDRLKAEQSHNERLAKSKRLKEYKQKVKNQLQKVAMEKQVLNLIVFPFISFGVFAQRFIL